MSNHIVVLTQLVNGDTTSTWPGTDVAVMDAKEDNIENTETMIVI